MSFSWPNNCLIYKFCLQYILGLQIFTSICFWNNCRVTQFSMTAIFPMVASLPEVTSLLMFELDRVLLDSNVKCPDGLWCSGKTCITNCEIIYVMWIKNWKSSYFQATRKQIFLVLCSIFNLFKNVSIYLKLFAWQNRFWTV